MSSNSERLEKLVDFDVTRRPTLTRDLFQEIVGDLKKERYEKAKTAAREQLVKAIELREKMHKVKREFEAQEKKFEKELGKLLNSVEASLEGSNVPPETDSEDSDS